jgi:hypothetical protein
MQTRLLGQQVARTAATSLALLCSVLLVNLGCQSPQVAHIMASPTPVAATTVTRPSRPSNEDHFGAAPSGPHMTPVRVAAWKEERALFQEVKNLYDLGRYREAKIRADYFLSTFPNADKREWVLRLKRKATQKLAK